MAAKKTSSSKALATWDEKLAKYAQQTADKEKAPVGQKISFRGGTLMIGGSPIKGNAARVVILDNMYLNSMYPPGSKFDPDSPTSPICFAMGREDEGLAPHEDSAEPQHDQCEGCPNNAFKTADNGKGKACKNGRRIAVIAANDLTAASVAEQEIFFADIPVTSVKGWAFFVKGLFAHFKRPPWAVITELAVVNDPNTQFRVTFTSEEPITDGKILAAIEKRVEEITESSAIMFPFPKPAPQAPAPKRGAAKPSKFAGKGRR